MAKKILVFGGLAAALAAGTICGTIYWQRKPSGGKPAKLDAATSPQVAYVDVKELTLRLDDTSMEHYIRLNPVLAVRVKAVDDLVEHEPVVRDCIVSIVTAYSSTELAKPQGQEKLKQQITESLRHEFHDEVVGIYFSGYLVE